MANGNGTQSTVDCGAPVEGSGAPVLVPTVTGPVSNETPLIISTMGGTAEPTAQPEAAAESVPVGSDCPWLLILLAFVVAYFLSRKGSS